MAFALIAGVVVVALLAIFFSSKGRASNAPGPSGLPFFGNLLEVSRCSVQRFTLEPGVYIYLHQVFSHYDKMLDQLLMWREKFGGTFQLNMPFMPKFIMITSPANVEHILKTNFDKCEIVFFLLFCFSLDLPISDSKKNWTNRTTSATAT